MTGAKGPGPSRSMRSTRQGEAVMRVLGEASGFRSAQDIHAELRERGERVGLTTVYRHLQLLAEDGLVDVLHGPDGESAYRRCASEQHHHHVVCRTCGLSVEVEGPEVEAWASRVAGRLGFGEISHTVEVFGVCPECSSASAGRRAGKGRAAKRSSGTGQRATETG